MKETTKIVAILSLTTICGISQHYGINHLLTLGIVGIISFLAGLSKEKIVKVLNLKK